MRLLHCAVGAEILPNPEPDSTTCYSLLAVSCNYFSGDRLGAGHEGESLSDCTPITAVPRTEASILPKGKTHAWAQEHILSGASPGCVV